MFTSYYLVNFFLWYAIITTSFYVLSYAVPKASFAARVLASYMALMLCAGWGIVSSAALTLAGKQGIAQWVVARAFHYTMYLVTGITFDIEDPKNILNTTRPAVFIGNHQTELDVLMLASMWPKWCSVTAKSSLKRTPVLGWFMTLSGTIFIDRKNSKDARDAMQGAANEITSRQQSVYMFPEGTRSYTKEPTLLPFKKGAFHLAVQAGVPIVPVVVANYSHVLYIKSFVFNAGRIPIKVLDPIPTKGLKASDVEELTRTTRELMLKEMIELTAKAQRRPIAMPAGTGAPSKATSTGVDTGSK
ncbi:unnamed protein product [Clonostachys solani]|uniref:1-acyl-sn-glycerol-3-phosphate acyltransferase n=1 Tax=Clonostachys solani TaxID=160281 RepID=A0A9N9Z4N7_9HYPO|nr:unnamed protein product [Clonostachys solani]